MPVTTLFNVAERSMGVFRPVILGSCLLTLGACATSEQPASEMAVPVEVAPKSTVSADVAALIDGLVGEYDNHEQILIERKALREGRRESPPHRRVHTLFMRIYAPQVGRDILFLEQYLDGDPAQLLRRQIHRFVDHPQRSAVKHLVFDFLRPEEFDADSRSAAKFQALTLDQLAPRPGCQMLWRKAGNYLQGETEPGQCKRKAPDGRELIVSQDLRLYPNALWILDRAFDAEGRPAYGPPDGTHQKSVRAVRYTGFAGVKAQGERARAGDNQWRYQRSVSLHSEGDVTTIVDETGAETGYALKLERLGAEVAPFAMRKLSLLDRDAKRTIGYSWAAGEGNRVGFNLGWAQAGLERAE